jgi:hypothetical protein
MVRINPIQANIAKPQMTKKQEEKKAEEIQPQLQQQQQIQVKNEPPIAPAAEGDKQDIKAKDPAMEQLEVMAAQNRMNMQVKNQHQHKNQKGNAKGREEAEDYKNHGQFVREAAHNKDVAGGNHGQSVREAAHNKLNAIPVAEEQEPEAIKPPVEQQAA